MVDFRVGPGNTQDDLRIFFSVESKEVLKTQLRTYIRRHKSQMKELMTEAERI